MIKDNEEYRTLYVTLSDDFEYTEWRTGPSGNIWECLMGMSWEQIDPPKEVIKEFRRLSILRKNKS